MQNNSLNGNKGCVISLYDRVMLWHKVKIAIRKYFYEQGFIEAQTKMLIKSNAPDANIDPFFVSSHVRSEQFQLPTSPELALKKLLRNEMIEKIFSLDRVFRDDIKTDRHNLEFTMAEWYRKESTIGIIKNDCLSLINIVSSIIYDLSLATKKREFLSTKSFAINDLFKSVIGIDLEELFFIKGDLVKQLQDKGERLPSGCDFLMAFFHCMIKYIEPSLPKDSIVLLYDWPIQTSALACVSERSEAFCDRFELYYNGVELANAYQECNESKTIFLRFQKENIERHKLAKKQLLIDEDFINSLDYLGPMAGVAMGIDRLIFCFCDDLTNINDLYF